MNAGASLYIGGKAESMEEGIALAGRLIDSGKSTRDSAQTDRNKQSSGGAKND